MKKVLAILLTCYCFLINTAFANESTIAIGEIVHGTLENPDPQLSANQFFDLYTVNGAQGQELLINLMSSDFDAFLGLLSPSGELIAINDDTGDAMGALISNLSLPQTGTYTIVVTSHDAEETGAYALALSETPSIADPDLLWIGDHIEMNLSHTDSQFSTGQFYDTYRFEATYGQAISIVMRSNQLDTYLMLLDHKGKVITVNNNSRVPVQEDFGSEIIFFPPISGSYTILTSSTTPLTEGDYQLIIETKASPIEAKALAETVAGQLEKADFQLNDGQYLDIYTFEGEKGEQITLGLSSPEFDSYLRILDSYGNVVKQDDDSGGGKDALIKDFSLPRTGTYYVWVSSVFAGEAGEYVLSLNEDSLRSSRKKLDIGTEDNVKISLSEKITGGNAKQIERLPRKGQPFTNATVCEGTLYTAKVKICIGNRENELTSSVKLSGSPSGFIIFPSSMDFTVQPDSCVTKSPFKIIGGYPAGVKTITATVKNFWEGKDASDSEVMKVVKVEIEGPALTIESMNSDKFKANVIPQGVVSGYTWKAKWPENAGHKPGVNFANASAKETIVRDAQWFAFPDSRWASDTGYKSDYEITLAVDIGNNTKCESQSHTWTVKVIGTGTVTPWPIYSGENTIQITQSPNDNLWYVTGRGQFRRHALISVIDTPIGSDFYNQVKAHEDHHVTQFASVVPWKNMWDVNTLYNNVLSKLPGQTSKQDMQNLVNDKINDWILNSNQEYITNQCEIEWQAFSKEYTVDPAYLEVKRSEVPGLYGCSF